MLAHSVYNNVCVHTHALAYSHGFFRHGFGIGNVVLHDGLEKLVFVFAVERRLHTKGEEVERRYVRTRADRHRGRSLLRAFSAHLSC